MSKDELCSDLLQQHSAKTLTEALRMVSGPGSVYEKGQVVDLSEGLVLASTDEADTGSRFPHSRFLAAATNPNEQIIRHDRQISCKRETRSTHQFTPIRGMSTSGDVRWNEKPLAFVILYVDADRIVKRLLYASGIGESEETCWSIRTRE